MIERPARAGFATAHFETRLEVVRTQSSLYSQEAKRVRLRRVERNGAAIKWYEGAHCFGNGTEQRLLSEVRNDGVVDVEEAAFQFLALVQRFFCPFFFGNVFRQRHYESWPALGARNQRYGVAHPDQAAILASISLLDLKLSSFSFQQLRGERPVGFAVVRVSNIDERKRPEILFAVAHHFLVDRIGGQEAAFEVGQ